MWVSNSWCFEQFIAHGFRHCEGSYSWLCEVTWSVHHLLAKLKKWEAWNTTFRRISQKWCHVTSSKVWKLHPQFNVCPASCQFHMHGLIYIDCGSHLFRIIIWFANLLLQSAVGRIYNLQWFHWFYVCTLYNASVCVDISILLLWLGQNGLVVLTVILFQRYVACMFRYWSLCSCIQRSLLPVYRCVSLLSLYNTYSSCCVKVIQYSFSCVQVWLFYPCTSA